MSKYRKKLMPKTVSSKDIQTSYKAIFEEVLRVKEPIVVMKNNQPQVAIVSVDYLEDLQTRAVTYEEMEALDTLRSYEESLENNESVDVVSIRDLLKKVRSEEKPSKYFIKHMEQALRDCGNEDYYSFDTPEEAIAFLDDTSKGKTMRELKGEKRDKIKK